MKVSLIFLAAALSITAASAAPHKPIVPAKDEGVHRCNVNLWPGFSATPCRVPAGVTNYNDCFNLVLKLGWRSSDAWWYCGSVHFKN